MKIKVGDKIRIREWDDMAQEFGINEDGDIKTKCFFTRRMKRFCGEVVEVKHVDGDYFVIKGDPHGNYFTADTILPFAVVITTDWKTTTAKMGEDVGIAKCSPDDEFVFEVGAKLALERLFESKKPFKPKKGEYYWFVQPNGRAGKLINDNFLFDLMAIRLGNCFRTKEAAERNADRILKEMGAQ